MKINFFTKIAVFLLIFAIPSVAEPKNGTKKVEFHEFQPVYIKVQTKSEKSTENSQKKVKFYNFDDLLIDGKVKKPQVLYTDARQKVKFERLLKLKKNFLPNLKNTRKDPALR